MKSLKNHLILPFGILVVLFLNSNSSFSQQTDLSFDPYWSINVNAGPNLFYGDIENYRFYKSFENNSEWRFGYGLIFQNTFSPVFTIRGQVLKSELSGTKRKINKWFVADIIETSMSIKVSISNLFAGTRDRTISLYGIAGLGLTQWKTQLMYLNSNEPIFGNGYTSGSGFNGRTVEAVMPFGLGVDLRINDQWEISFEGTLRPVNSDLLDANKGGFKYDFYSYNFIGITYKFGKKKAKAPEMMPEDFAVVEQPVKVNDLEIIDEELIVTDKLNEDNEMSLDDKLLAIEAKEDLYKETWKDVRFKVQISASKSETNISELAEDYQLELNSIQQHETGNWFTYNTGSFTKYWKAKEYCNLLVSRNHIYDAFVVAYKNDSKVPLQQLLIDHDINPVSSKSNEINSDSNFFSVQILATGEGSYSIKAIKDLFDIDDEIFIDKSNQLNRYVAGRFISYDKAAILLNDLLKKGIQDAFIVEYENGKRK